jgi:hypothetical protein
LCSLPDGRHETWPDLRPLWHSPGDAGRPGDLHELCVAVLNTSSDFIDILTEILELEGFNTIAEFTSVFRKGEKDIHTFFAEHQPDVVIYDIAIPYEIN